jgi:hypothetical protein
VTNRQADRRACIRGRGDVLEPALKDSNVRTGGCSLESTFPVAEAPPPPRCAARAGKARERPPNPDQGRPSAGRGTRRGTNRAKLRATQNKTPANTRAEQGRVRQRDAQPTARTPPPEREAIVCGHDRCDSPERRWRASVQALRERRGPRDATVSASADLAKALGSAPLTSEQPSRPCSRSRLRRDGRVCPPCRRASVPWRAGAPVAAAHPRREVVVRRNPITTLVERS